MLGGVNPIYYFEDTVYGSPLFNDNGLIDPSNSNVADSYMMNINSSNSGNSGTGKGKQVVTLLVIASIVLLATAKRN